jgi:transposase
MGGVTIKFVPAPILVCVELNPGPERLGDENKWRIIIYKKDFKMSDYEIAKKMGISHHTVSDVYARYEETGDVKERPGRGRKRKLSSSDTKKIKKMAKKGKCAPQIRRECKIDASPRTVQRELRKLGFFYGKIKKIERLSVKHKELRVEYAQDYEGYEWKKVFFSDEKTFELGVSAGYGWQTPENRLTVEYVKHAPKLQVWAAIGSYVKSDLVFFSGNMDGELYRDILEKNLKEKKLTYAADCPKRFVKKWFFLQDGAKPHTAKKTMTILSTLVGNRLVPHPAKSPDLNPIEDMWSYLDRKVKDAKITSIYQLKRFLKKEWRALPWSEIRKSVDSMDRRLHQCVESGGNRLPY